MHKLITPIFLIAGTSIGGGMLALPMVLAKLGLVVSLVIMLLTWLLTYYSSLISVELNLHSDRGLSLGKLGRRFSGEYAEIVGEISVKLLSYALLSAFIYGASSIIQKLLEEYLNYSMSIISIETYLSLIVVFVLSFPIKLISRLNNLAFSGFLIMFAVLIAVIATAIDYTEMPWFVNFNLKDIAEVITVIFTSFGYQVIFHTLRDYFGKDAKSLRLSFLMGSSIPVIVYSLWTGGALSVISKTNGNFFVQITQGNIEVGALIRELANVSGFSGFHILTWNMAIFAILTSILGVGIGLTESIRASLRISHSVVRNLSAAVLTILPAYLLAAVIPNAFTKILGFAGAILVVIAILLPAYLFIHSRFEKVYLRELKNWIIVICSIIGIGIIFSEFIAHNL